MIKEWRSKLFESISTEFTLNLLGFPLSVAEGTRILGICYRTWKRWETLAMLIPEYKLQHIQMLKRATDAKAVPPIIPYQVWVIGKIGEIYDGLPDGMTKKWMAEEYLKAKREEFTREAYRLEQEKFASNLLTEVKA